MQIIDLLHLYETDFQLGNDVALFVITLLLTVLHMVRAGSEIGFSWGNLKRVKHKITLKQVSKEKDWDKAGKSEQLIGELEEQMFPAFPKDPKNRAEAVTVEEASHTVVIEVGRDKNYKSKLAPGPLNEVFERYYNKMMENLEEGLDAFHVMLRAVQSHRLRDIPACSWPGITTIM